MSRRLRTRLAVAGGTAAVVVAGLFWQDGRSVAQTGNQPAPPPSQPQGQAPAGGQADMPEIRPLNPPDNGGKGNLGERIRLWTLTPAVTPRQQYTSEKMAGQLMQERVSNLFPGGVAVNAGIQSPIANDPGAVERGMQHFNAYNCVGCHAPNGSGGEGPSLSNSHWIYGGGPANIYLTIIHGRPNGMPAFGGMLTDQTVWELAAYIESISEQPDGHKGKTISRTSPQIQQVPAEYIQTTNPWQHTEPFTNGQKPQPPTAGQPQQANAGTPPPAQPGQPQPNAAGQPQPAGQGGAAGGGPTGQ